jgi:YHS domain-containing protein
MRPSSMCFAALALLSATAASSAPPAPEIHVSKNGLALGGYDPVAYFRDGRPMSGSNYYQLSYKGAVWRFGSAEALRQFQERPEAFAPQFGGYCAWAVSQHYLAPGDPQQWKIVDGKLYLNANARAKQLWVADQAGAIVRGHANWPAVLTANQESQ